ncbi:MULTISPECIES: Tol-Pal system beta propeller repeat protein TolB [unclassified Chelatococcus]|uniref:Tol-Pal system beta propeller repeat protein TolB n=1 Tax=unclassified Chelatococcus TaxID=2638111 RepID=UPI0020BE11F8|nr:MULTISPECIES: Tol-Pal system beta propeller repeat protein TolB [unclassified Chelatococcus]
MRISSFLSPMPGRGVAIDTGVDGRNILQRTISDAAPRLRRMLQRGRNGMARGGLFAWRGVAIGAAAFIASAVVQPARAEITITLDRANFQPLPVAITDFAGDGDLGAKIAGVISANLRRCGYFVPLDRQNMPPSMAGFDAVPQFQQWQALNVQGLVTGRVTREGSGRLKVEFRLWDVPAGQQLTGQQYFTDPANWRRIAHIISDAVFTRLTGLKGMFDTKIVFVDESGPKESRRKRLAVMDQDGANVRFLTRGEDLVVTPRFSPTSSEIAYMAQRRGSQPHIQLLNLDTNQREMVGNFPDMTSSPRFSPDGSKLLLSLQQGGNANIYVMDLRSRTTTRLTSTNAIDTSPSFSPDGSQIVFESDRGGQPQLYVMPASGGEARRISFGQGTYGQPVWSPRGDYIAFTRQSGGRFGIGIMKPDGSGERLLTEGFHNEGPTWAPNGQFLMLWRDGGGANGGRIFMVDITGRVEVPVPTPSFASDPAWSSVLTEIR